MASTSTSVETSSSGASSPNWVFALLIVGGGAFIGGAIGLLKYRSVKAPQEVDYIYAGLAIGIIAAVVFLVYARYHANAIHRATQEAMLTGVLQKVQGVQAAVRPSVRPAYGPRAPDIAGRFAGLGGGR